MTIAASSAFDSAAGHRTAPRSRTIGLLTIATGIAGIALLAMHPGGDATTFAGVLKDEADHLVPNAIVHGGFIAVMALQLVCYAVLSARLGWARTATVAALVFFALGVMFMSFSLLLDGLVTPAIAARYVLKPDKIESARVIFVLIGSLVSFLMPIGLLFQSAAIAAWGWALTASGSRAAGLFALALGGVMCAALAFGFVAMNPFILMGAIAGTALWAFVAGTSLLRAA